MTTPLWCLVIVAFIPLVLAGLGGYSKIKELGSLDNNDPRGQYLQLQGVGRRIWAAQQNAWEAVALFTVAVVVAHLAGADPAKAAMAAQVVVVARVLHALCYIADQATLRSLIFGVGLGGCIYLIYLAGSVG